MTMLGSSFPGIPSRTHNVAHGTASLLGTSTAPPWSKTPSLLVCIIEMGPQLPPILNTIASHSDLLK